MTTPNPPGLSRPAQELFDIVVGRSARQAALFVLDLLDSGRPMDGLVTDVLAPVQAEVGAQWQRSVLTAADEHAATAAIDHALATLAVAGRPPIPADRGTMAVVCAEGDWHTLPARMAAELWRWDGWDVTYLGGSLPPADLGRWLASARPDVLAVTCSVPLFIPGVLSLGETAAQEGVACVVGGRGLGTDSRRAAALGLRWAGSAAGLIGALDGPEPSVDRGELSDRRSETQDIESDIAEVVTAAVGALTAHYPAISSYTPRQLFHTRQDYAFIVQFLSAAVLSDDPLLFTEFLRWQQAILTSRGLPASVLPMSIDALHDVFPGGYQRAKAMLGAAAGSALGMDR